MALKRIVLRDFAIVSELELDLESGFSVLTGETGAGKSILIDALQLVTGARAESGVVREGAGRTDISAEFDTLPSMTAFLEDAGFEPADTLLLRRTVDVQGKSRAWVNGSPATAQQLRALGEQLLDIHGQHAWQSLTRPDTVRGLLDAYAQLSTESLSQAWAAWRKASNSLENARATQHSLHQERERLAWQIGELEKLDPQPGEWDNLSTTHQRLSNGQTLLDAALGAANLIEYEDNNALRHLHQAVQLLEAQMHLEPEFKDPVEALRSGIAQLDDAARALRGYARKTDLEPERLAELDARIAAWVSLARRYRSPAEDLPALLAGWREALQRLDAAGDLDTLQAAEAHAAQHYQAQAAIVTQRRRQAAPLLASAITQAMQGLGMQGGTFEVQLQPCEPAQWGLEDALFLVAGHAGSTPRPVGKVASGGELSRIALAIAVTTSRLGTAHTLIFDEVDSGIGGAVAQTVGRLLKQLGSDRQVLAVTHLPQVAACANHHLLVSKQLHGTTTLSTVRTVSGKARITEIARMLGGEKLSDTTLTHAKEMLQSSK